MHALHAHTHALHAGTHALMHAARTGKSTVMLFAGVSGKWLIVYSATWIKRVHQLSLTQHKMEYQWVIVRSAKLAAGKWFGTYNCRLRVIELN